MSRDQPLGTRHPHRRIARGRGWFAAGSFAFAIFSAGAGTAIDYGSLAAGATHHGRLAADQRADHQVAVDGGLAAVLTLRIVDGNGAELRWSGAAQPLRAEGGRGAIVRRTLLADTDTRWQIGVAPYPGDVGVSYSLSLGATHPASSADHVRILAEDAYAQALALQRSSDADRGPRITSAYQDAIDAWKQAGDSCGLRTGYLGQALFRNASKDFVNAAASARSALEQHCDDDEAGQAQAESALGTALFAQGDRSGATEARQRALALYRKTGDVRSQSALLETLGEDQRALGRREDALQAAQSAFALAQTSGDSASIARARRSIAAIHLDRGELTWAAESYQATLDDLRKAPDTSAEGSVWRNLGVIHRRLGDSDDAEQAWTKADAACTAGDSWSCVAGVALDRGDALLDAGRPAEAAQAYLRALDVATVRSLPREQAAALAGSGLAAAGLGHWEEARARLEAARKGFNDLQQPGDEAKVWIALGDIKVHQQGNVAAQRDYAKALELARRSGDDGARVVALTSLARIARAYGEIGEARRYIEQSLTAIESHGASLHEPGLHSVYVTSPRSCYELQIDILMQLERERPGRGHAAAALAAAERARAYALREQLTAQGIDLESKAAAGLLADERRAGDRVHIASDAVQRLTPQTAAAERAAALSELDAANHQLETARAAIRTADPGYAELMYPTTLTADEAEHLLLDADATLLEYWLGDSHSYLWVATHKSLRAYFLPARMAIEPLADQLLRKLSAPPVKSADTQAKDIAKKQTADIAAARELAGKLGQILLKPAALPAGGSVVVVGDGILQRVPFTYLSPGAGAKIAAFGSKHGLVTLPSMTTLRWLRRVPMHSKDSLRVALLADPVLGTDDARPTAASAAAAAVPDQLRRTVDEVGASLRRSSEAHEVAGAIAAIASNQPLLALDFDASRDTLQKTHWDDYAVAHFAAPALLDLAHPQRSGVVLSLYDVNGNVADGYLRIDDLYHLRMPVDLVVLGDCASPRSTATAPSDVFALSRAFFHAGAPRVIVSLWSIDEHASAQFMRHFYSALVGLGLPPQSALQRAQMQMARDPQLGAPGNWAGFVVQGDWR